MGQDYTISSQRSVLKTEAWRDEFIQADCSRHSSGWLHSWNITSVDPSDSKYSRWGSGCGSCRGWGRWRRTGLQEYRSANFVTPQRREC